VFNWNTAIFARTRKVKLTVSIAYCLIGTIPSQAQFQPAKPIDIGKPIEFGTPYDDCSTTWRSLTTDKQSCELGNQGTRHTIEKNYLAAIDAYSQAINRSPRHSRYYSDRAIAYSMLNQNDKAMDDVNKAISLDSKNWDAYGSRGYLHLLYGRADPAVDDLTKAIVYGSGSSHRSGALYSERGQAYEILGSKNAAIQDYRMALAYDSTLSGARERLQAIWPQALNQPPPCIPGKTGGVSFGSPFGCDSNPGPH
jgi:hypothetical protein